MVSRRASATDLNLFIRETPFVQTAYIASARYRCQMESKERKKEESRGRMVGGEESSLRCVLRATFVSFRVQRFENPFHTKVTKVSRRTQRREQSAIPKFRN